MRCHILDKPQNPIFIIFNGRMDPVQKLIDDGNTEDLLIVLAGSPELASNTNEDGRTIAQLIIATKQTDMLLTVLSRHSVNLDNQDAGGWCALHQAASSGILPIVEAILPHGSKLQTKGGQTALHYAAGKGHLPVINAILPHSDIKLCDGMGQTALHRAATLGQTQVVAILLGHDHSIIDWRDKEGNTALNLAAQEGHNATVKLLLELGAEKSIPNNEGHLPAI
jgi:ankyrin repeat protein